MPTQREKIIKKQKSYWKKPNKKLNPNTRTSFAAGQEIN